MKIRSLLLGSVAAAGLSTGAFAADLGVLTSLDVCDSLGLSGLTISSDTNCLQITGSVKYEFSWGDYEGPTGVSATALPNSQSAPANTVIVATDAGNFTIPTPGDGPAVGTADNMDWYSKVDAWIKFVATAESDFGPAKAVIKIKDLKERKTVNELEGVDSADAGTDLDTFIGGDDTGGAMFDEAYVSVGDSTVIMAGKKGSIANFNDDAPLNFLGLFNSEKEDVGVDWDNGIGNLDTGGHVIQITTDLGNGLALSGGLENLDDTLPAWAGTAVGVISYAGDGIAAHATFLAGGILDGNVDAWSAHAGFTGTFDIVKVVAAGTINSTGFWNVLGSAAATFDMFTLAVSGEATSTGDYGVGASVGAAVTDTVSINLGGRWYHDNATLNDGYQAAVQLVAAVTETITLTGEVGLYGRTAAPLSVYYGAATVAWAPGGGFTSSLKGEVYSNGAYKATFKAAKTFE